MGEKTKGDTGTEQTSHILQRTLQERPELPVITMTSHVNKYTVHELTMVTPSHKKLKQNPPIKTKGFRIPVVQFPYIFSY